MATPPCPQGASFYLYEEERAVLTDDQAVLLLDVFVHADPVTGEPVSIAIGQGRFDLQRVP